MSRYKNTFAVISSIVVVYCLYLSIKLFITVLMSYLCWEMLRVGASSHFEAKTKMTGEELAGKKM